MNPIPTNGRGQQRMNLQKGYTRHEVADPRVAGPSGRTADLTEWRSKRSGPYSEA
jgi:hypothetical protein